jgi:hypothetical protein
MFSSLFNVFFLQRKFLSALILVFASNYPYFQIQALCIMSLSGFCYLGAVKPYVEMKTNLNESFNEICILLCIYVVMFSMITLNIKTLD